MSYRPATIRLHRRNVAWRNRLVRYRVTVDGQTVGRIAQGETLDLTVEPGERHLRLTVNGVFSSPERKVSLEEGGFAEFMCGPGGPSIESALIFLRPHRYIALDGPVQWPR